MIMNQYYILSNRLTPLLAAVLLIVPNLWTYVSYGTIVPERVDQFDSCKKSWWSLLLYIQNLYRGPEGDVSATYFNHFDGPEFTIYFMKYKG